MDKITLNEFLELRNTENAVDCSKLKIIGKSKLREYKIWKALKNRVTNPNRADVDHYFNKGITCCEEWFNCFEQFLYDMGMCPDKTYSIDRINNDLGYSKDNCRWASSKTQNSNRKDFNLVYTYQGESKVLKAWAEHFGIKYTTLYMRIFRNGMTFEEAINYVNTPTYELQGKTKSLKEWCILYDMEYKVVYNRLMKHKWSIEEALTVKKGERRNKI